MVLILVAQQQILDDSLSGRVRFIPAQFQSKQGVPGGVGLTAGAMVVCITGSVLLSGRIAKSATPAQTGAGALAAD